MNDFGLKLLGHAIEHLTYSPIINPYWNVFGLLHTAQAGEILIKSCIAIEHPLLIFNKLPKMAKLEESLTFEYLLKEGKTANYTDLPDLLWATTNYRIKNLQLYKEFGNLRNNIQHFAVPDINYSEYSFRYIFEVLEPIINHFWGEFVLDNLEDEVTYEYVLEQLVRYDIKFMSNS